MNKSTIAQKKQTAEEFAKVINDAKSILIFEFLGLNAKETAKLRHKLHDENAVMYVLKNNILNRALASSKINGMEEFFGPNAIIVSKGNEVISYKLIDEIMKEKSFVSFKSGVIDNKIITKDQFSTVASLPGRDGLYSMLLSCLQGSIRNFLYGLKAISESKN